MKILVANKIDIDDPEVTQEMGQELANQHGMHFYATSAKTGENVDLMFEQTATRIIEKQLIKKERELKEKAAAP